MEGEEENTKYAKRQTSTFACFAHFVDKRDFRLLGSDTTRCYCIETRKCPSSNSGRPA